MSLADGPTLWTLTLDGVQCNGHAWWVKDCHRLRPSVDKRGSDQLVPGVPGKYARGRVADSQTELLEVLITGAVTSAGVTASDPIAQLQDNVDEFIASVVEHTTDTITAVLTGPHAVYSGEVIVEKFRPGDGLYDCVAALTVTIPAGRLELAGS